VVFNLRTETPHPNIASFISELLLEEEKNRFDITRIMFGFGKNSKSDVLKEEKLKICVESFKLYDSLEYLEVVYKIYKFKMSLK
jgi:hypothetical protein